MPALCTRGAKPFIFARNVNIGIKACPDADGYVILNDDAILQTPGGFSLLAQAAKDNPEYGIIAATTNNVGNPNQQPRGVGLREELRMVCFVAVYIPRTTIEKVGLLDERFVGYGMDDDDYSLRVRNAGLKIGIHDGCYVDHGSLKSTYRGDPTAPADFRPNLELFKQKWGHDNFGVKA
jgi:GT2 family glycosyltransferase